MKLFGCIKPDEVGAILGTGFNRFECKRLGIHGLMKVTNSILEVLAVGSRIKRRGNFREFVRQCQRSYSEVIFWHVENPIVEDALSRYGFIATQKYDQGERIPGMIWVAT